ncbi:hypothetical protein KC866_03915 [Patescibacteria group bacterium]|nr:hypothetical protein [Patescibacteria group bacterium]
MKKLHIHPKTNPETALLLRKGDLQEDAGSEAPPFRVCFTNENIIEATKKIIERGIHATFKTQAHILAFLNNGFKSEGVYSVYVE